MACHVSTCLDLCHAYIRASHELLVEKGGKEKEEERRREMEERKGGREERKGERKE